MPVSTRSSARGVAPAPSNLNTRSTRGNKPAAGSRSIDSNTAVGRKRKGAAGGDPPAKRTRSKAPADRAGAGRPQRLPSTLDPAATTTTAAEPTIAERVKSRKRAREAEDDNDSAAVDGAPSTKRAKRSAEPARRTAASTKRATKCTSALAASTSRAVAPKPGCPANYHRQLPLPAWSAKQRSSTQGATTAIEPPSFKRHIETCRERPRATPALAARSIVPRPLRPDLPTQRAGPVYKQRFRWPLFRKCVGGGVWRAVVPAPALARGNGIGARPLSPSRLWRQRGLRLRADGGLEYVAAWSVNGTPHRMPVPRWQPRHGTLADRWGVRGADDRRRLRVRGGSRRDDVGEVFGGLDYLGRETWVPIVLGPCAWDRIPGAMRALPSPVILAEVPQAMYPGPWDDGDEEREDEAEDVADWLRRREGKWTDSVLAEWPSCRPYILRC